MKKISVILLALLAVLLAGCSSTSAYEYEYEIIDTHTACEPDLETWQQMLELFYGESQDKTSYDSAVEKAKSIVACNETELQAALATRGDEGWRLITFDTITPGQYDLGIEYTYRLVWERAK